MPGHNFQHPGILAVYFRGDVLCLVPAGMCYNGFQQTLKYPRRAKLRLNEHNGDVVVLCLTMEAGNSNDSGFVNREQRLQVRLNGLDGGVPGLE